MSVRFSQLQCKEVICVEGGQRLGFVSDVLVELPQGTVCALVVPGQGKLWGLAGRREDFLIPWGSVKKIGPDIVLVDVQPESCRVPRSRPGPLPPWQDPR